VTSSGRTPKYSPRPLSEAERDTLELLLRHTDFEGRDALLAQIDHASVVGGCGCGCATVDLKITGNVPPSARRSELPRPVPTKATALDNAGEPIGGVLLFEKDGYLATLEIYNHGPEPINPFPPIEQLRVTP
jgi:hypothetical protein